MEPAVIVNGGGECLPAVVVVVAVVKVVVSYLLVKNVLARG